MKKILQDRKTLYLILVIVVVSVFSLSIAYAAMSAVLEIHGNSEVVASSWDIHLDNIKVKSGSVSANAPQISGTSSVGFDVELNTPGDFYEFTVDVVNDGSIDAMIDSVVKTPELTSEQAKYIKYEITYANGESISTKQTLKKGTSTPIKVRVEYRKDLVVSDLPTTATELSLKLTLVYVQSDGSGSEIPNNGVDTKLVNVVSGDYDTVGSEICIKEECFYVISSNSTSVTMFAKYNLSVGNVATIDYAYFEYTIAPLSNPTGKQDSTMIGYVYGEETAYGTTRFSDVGGEYSGSVVESYVNNYSSYLMTLGVIPSEARLITIDELVSLGCDNFNDLTTSGSCLGAPNWINSTTYWTSSYLNDNSNYLFAIFKDLGYSNDSSFYLYDYYLGVRPVITIAKSYF